MRLERNKAERLQRGAILLEVVLALVLFAAAATVVGIALNAALGSVDRLRFSAHAADRSLTVFSELQLGIRSLADLPPTNENTNAWTVEIIGKPWSGASSDLAGTLTSAAPLTEVEVVIRHESGFVHRARQVMRLKSAAAAAAARPDSKPGGLASR